MKAALQRNLPSLGALVLISFQILETPAAEVVPLRLQGGRGELTVDARGIRMTTGVAGCPAVEGQNGPQWAVLVQPDVPPPVPGEPIVLTDQGQAVTRAATEGGTRLSCGALTDGKRTWKIGVTVDIRRAGDAFEITGEVRNDEPGWVVCGFTGPELGGIRADLATQPALWPEGLGRRLDRAPDATKPAPWKPWGRQFEFEAAYPGRRGTMSWCAFAGAGGGLYLASHDAAHGAKTLCIRHDPDAGTYGFTVKHRMFVAAGGRWALPPTVIAPYEGTWHAAAHRYRAWADTVAKPMRPPAWAADASGWLLAILKQQNGAVLWDYASLGALCDVADARGLDILGLFGWAHGGHDHLYPEYRPDPLMGGETALRAGLAEARRRGKRTILYANGQLQEIGTEFWTKRGRALTVIGRDGEPVLQTYHKYRTTPPFRFGLGCLLARDWYDLMLGLALQANDLGADGILYDQLGIFEPMPCYGAGHGHPVPVMVYAEDRVRFLRRIADHMRTLNPDFIVMTEGLHDTVLDSTAMFHGCTLGTFEVTGDDVLGWIGRKGASVVFPEMFRAAYPEVASTIRMPSPMIGRAMANYTCAYGFRFEIESRYAPDVRYLREDRVPEAADYGEVINTPNVPLMKSVPPADATRYLRQMVDFMRVHADLFWRGRFVDTEGFAFRGEGLVAKGFAAGDRLGVLVWNPGAKDAPFTLDVPGAALVSASDPEHGKVDAFAAMPPQSVRLLVWRKR
ncbi:MAG: hypothetical protein KJ579_07235 [Verrucomicrobia bacterium]|nr:hypothetical protein [Verrucomicrobiota bacterium]